MNRKSFYATFKKENKVFRHEQQKIMEREQISSRVQEARKKVLPSSYDKRKAVLGAVIALLVFGIGALLGANLPWWITLVVAAGAAFGGYVGMAYFDKQFNCQPAPPVRL